MTEANEMPRDLVEKPVFPPLRIFTETKSDPSHPERNEDAIFADENSKVVVILDGMGGLEAGDKVSRVAGSFIFERLKGIPEDSPIEPTGRLLGQVLADASSLVRQEVERGGTTATAVKFVRGGNQMLEAVIAHVGDTRAFVARRSGQGPLQRVTEDDLLVFSNLSIENKRRLQEKLDRVTNKQLLGGLSDKIARKALSGDERRAFSGRHRLSQFLGAMENPANLTPHIYYRALSSGDSLILTSDGVHDNLTSDEIEAVVRNNVPAVFAQRLVSEAFIRSNQYRTRSGQLTRSHHDDISAVVVRVG